MSHAYIAALILVSLPAPVLTGYAVFKDWEDFWESIRYWLTPDALSAFRGEWTDDQWAELKLFFVVAVWLVSVLGIHFKLGSYLQNGLAALGF